MFGNIPVCLSVCLYTMGPYALLSVCLSIHPGLWELWCASPQWYRTTLCTTDLRCAWCTRARTHNIVFLWLTMNMQIKDHTVVLYGRTLGGAQDNFACSLSAQTLMVHNTMLSVQLSIPLHLLKCPCNLKQFHRNLKTDGPATMSSCLNFLICLVPSSLIMFVPLQ